MIGLATSIPEGGRVVSASDVSAKIKAGQIVDFDNCTIVGELNLHNLSINEKVHFNNTLFQNSMNCELVTFNKDAYFTGSEFNGTAFFTYCCFNDNVNFDKTKFNTSASFGQSIFEGAANFQSSKFNGDAHFDISDFRKNANFIDSQFKGDAIFQKSKFNGINTFQYSNFTGADYFTASSFDGGTHFDSSKFNSYVSFIGSKFNDFGAFNNCTFKKEVDFSDSTFNRAYFEKAKFSGNANFMYSLFNSETSFSGSTFNGDVQFTGSRFDIVNFKAVQFDKEAQFDDTKFNENTSFDSARFNEDALFEGANFDCTLNLSQTKYDNLYIRWRNINDLAYNDAAYLSLLENFKKLGYLEDYDNCYFEYRKEHRDQSWSGGYHGMSIPEEWVRKKIDVVLELSYGYGKRPLYPLIGSIATILIFGVLWGILGHRNQGISGDRYSVSIDQIVDASPRRPTKWDKIILVLKPFIFSSTLFLSGTKLFVDPPEVPEIPGLSTSLIKSLFTFERVLGAFFSILLFIAIGATIVR